MINWLFLLAMCVIFTIPACKWETSEEYYARKAAPCVKFCATHNGMAHIAEHMTGGFVNERNEFCVCNDGVTVPK